MYRRWPSKIPLVVDTLTQMKPPTPAAVGEDTTTREALSSARWPGSPSPTRAWRPRVLAGLVDVMSRNEELAQAVRSVLVSVLVAERERRLIAVIERGKQRGEIRPEVDARVMVDLLGGPVVLRRLFTGGPVNQRLAHAIVDLVMDGAAQNASSSAAQ